MGKRVKTEERDESYFKFLIVNNKALAKALSEERIINKQHLDENYALQKKLSTAMSLNMRYEKALNQLLAESKHALPACNVILDNMARMIKLCSDGVNLPKSLGLEHKEKNISYDTNIRSVSPGILNNKSTNAVKPMISGHVIFRPTINLWRLNDTEHAEFSRSLESTSVELTVNNTDSQTTSTPNNLRQNHNNLASHRQTQPIQGLRPVIYDEEIQEPELSSTELENEGNPAARLNGISSIPLTTVDEIEVEEFEVNEFEISPIPILAREARILINPIRFPFEETVQQPTKSTSDTYGQDPLEGPSTLLDDSGHFTSPPRHVSKPRAVNAATRQYNECNFDSDSSSDDDRRKAVRNKYVPKPRSVRIAAKQKPTYNIDSDSNCGDDIRRKAVRNKNVTKRKTSHSINNNENKLMKLNEDPVVLLTRTDLTNYEKNTLPGDNEYSQSSAVNDKNITNSTERPRRNKVKGSFKERSLRWYDEKRIIC